jgi:hypothetical protein
VGAMLLHAGPGDGGGVGGAGVGGGVGGGCHSVGSVEPAPASFCVSERGGSTGASPVPALPTRSWFHARSATVWSLIPVEWNRSGSRFWRTGSRGALSPGWQMYVSCARYKKKELAPAGPADKPPHFLVAFWLDLLRGEAHSRLHVGDSLSFLVVARVFCTRFCRADCALILSS